MQWLDRWLENSARGLARRTSRRDWLAHLGWSLVGAASIPLLPVSRAWAAEADPGDPTTCAYWRHCAIDGFLCGCCGGSQNTCPPGTQVSPVTWIGTCRNPGDGKDYVVSYNDCCGKSGCGRCFCNRNEGDRPLYRPSESNDINWCQGLESNAYHCSTAIVIGLASKPK
jgi:methylamine dehydrogenase light chain